MKQFVVIGLGRFGVSVATELYKMGHEVLAIDSNVERIDEIADSVTHAVCADATDEAELSSLGLRNFDVAVVSIGSDLQASILVTMLCKELGVMDVALASQVVQHDMNTSALGDDIGLLSGINQIYIPSDEKMTALMEQCIAEKEIHYKVGTIATGDLFMQGERQKEKLHQRFDAIAAEMEGGSIGHVCYMNHVPFTVLRTISDGEGGAMDYAQFAQKAAKLGIEIVIEFIKKIIIS